MFLLFSKLPRLANAAEDLHLLKHSFLIALIEQTPPVELALVFVDVVQDKVARMQTEVAADVDLADAMVARGFFSRILWCFQYTNGDSCCQNVASLRHNDFCFVPIVPFFIVVL